jgi:thiol-disulfide isomerase/thioredoxin
MARLPRKGRRPIPRLGVGLAVATGVCLVACAGVPGPPEVRHHLTGQEFPLEAFRGHVLLLNFWATWCKPCLSEVPELAKTADAYGDRVVFVALYYQPQLTAAAQVTDWLRLQPDYFAHYVAWGNASLLALYPHRLLPTTYVVGRSGTVVKKFEGSITTEARLTELRASIDAGLKQPWPVPGQSPAPPGDSPPPPQAQP